MIFVVIPNYTSDWYMMNYETLRCAVLDENILVITLNRPKQRNALNTHMAEELHHVVEAYLQGGAVRSAILTGTGAAFCAGGDLKQRDDMEDERWHAQHLVFERMFAFLLNSPVPIIAAVNGAAFGGGCELALACDFIYAAKSATFCFPEVGIGIIPGGGGTQTLQRAIGVRRAREMILLGTLLDANKALEWGLVNRVVDDNLLVDTVEGIARQIAAQAPLAVRQARRSISQGQEVGLSAALAFEIEAYVRTVGTRDRREGVKAALERRKPRFEGR
jgi:enoyl-CoA hydratase/carnithine racemase